MLIDNLFSVTFNVGDYVYRTPVATQFSTVRASTGTNTRLYGLLSSQRVVNVTATRSNKYRYVPSMYSDEGKTFTNFTNTLRNFLYLSKRFYYYLQG